MSSRLRQLRCSSVHHPAGRYKISAPHSTGTRHTTLCSRQEHGISAIHIPGEWYHIAEGESRIFRDLIELMMDHNLFKQITKHLGLPVVDLFASQDNHQTSEFVSWGPEPGQ